MSSPDRACDDLLQHLLKLDEGERTIFDEMRTRVRWAHSREVREVLGQWTQLAGEQRRRLASAAAVLEPERNLGANTICAGASSGEPRVPFRLDDRPLLEMARTLAGRQAKGYESALRIAGAAKRSEAADLLNLCLECAQTIEAVLAMVADELGPRSPGLAA